MIEASKIALAASCAVAMLFTGTPFTVVSAQESGSFELEEVVVTASKRGLAESLQEMSLSIQALTENDIINAGITDLSGISQLAPSLTIVDIFGTGSPQISMRGITSGEFASDSVQDKALTSVYLDDMPLSATNYVPNIELFDIARVEVLRGPQGTLYGAGAMGGNVRFVTNKASTEEMTGRVEIGANSVEGGDEGYSVKGMINLPFSDSIALRIVGSHQEDGGFIDNIVSNKKNDNELVRSSLRGSLRFEPNDKLDATLNVFYQEQESGDTPSSLSDLGAKIVFAGHDSYSFIVGKCFCR